MNCPVRPLRVRAASAIRLAFEEPVGRSTVQVECSQLSRTEFSTTASVRGMATTNSYWSRRNDVRHLQLLRIFSLVGGRYVYSSG